MKTLKMAAALGVVAGMILGGLWFQIWRVQQFQKATHFGFWKAWVVLGK